MANYVELNGIRTWYDEQGTGEPLVLLHPGGVGVDSRAFGPNLGALAALLVAHQRPDLVQRLLCVAGPFHRSGCVASAIEPGLETPAFLVSSYGEVSPDGQEHYQVVQRKLDQMHTLGPTLTTDDLGSIGCRTLVMVGDDDEVPLEHAVAFYRALPRGEFAVVPGTSHGLLVEKPDLCNKIVVDFLTRDPVPTLAPIRRA
jgi:pimeloyl-ACP methyl ester carboxylesterase